VLPLSQSGITAERDSSHWGAEMTKRIVDWAKALAAACAASGLALSVTGLAWAGEPVRDARVLTTHDGWAAIIQPAQDAPGQLERSRSAEADRLYRDARSYLNLREWTAAHRLLRIITSRFPGTPAAARATADLKRIERDIFGAARRFSLGGPDLNVEPPGSWSASPNERGVGLENDDGWRVETRSGGANKAGRAKIGNSAGRQVDLNQNTAKSRGAANTSQPVQERFRANVGDRVFFPAFSDKIGRKGKVLLRAQAQWLRANPGTSARIEAHADEPGRKVDQDALSQRRAEAVMAYFSNAGIDPARLTFAAFGRSKRIAVCDTPACRAQNRRVVVRVERSSSSELRADNRRHR